MTILRYATLTAVLAGAMPAPASAQLGKFLKKKLKEKIVQTAADTVLSKVAGGDSMTATPGSAPGAANPAGAARARKGAPATQGPAFDEYNPEITSDLLDRFEKALTAEAARQKADGRPTKTSMYDGVKAGGFSTPAPYAMLKERVFPFCAATAPAEASGPAMRVPTGSGGIYWVYTPAEAQAMKPRCARLMPLLRSVM